jgi:catechol 2,3-dioxygenase-like lactoylglutathione lyase family enzyme
MQVKGISWVGVRTDSYRDMREFFAGILGLPAVHEAPDFTVFQLPNGDKVEIFGPSGPQPPAQFARDDLVTSFLVQDIDKAVEELRAAGAEIIGTRGDGGNGYRWQHFRAPDGKVFELVEDPAHS